MKAKAQYYEGFNVRGLRELTKHIQTKPELLEQSWKELMKGAFDLAEPQREFLDSCPEELDKQLQEHFREAAKQVRQGGQAQLRVLADEEGGRAFYLVASPEQPGSKAQPRLRDQKMIRIVCCDANCGNWHWCWNEP